MTTIASAPSDQSARDRILSDLDTNLLVEAGAGSGKTTSLVGRMLALVRRGTPVEHLAAVTFTRKAATELRERFEIELERALREGGDEPEVRERISRAREHLDSAFLGTIHSFCGRLLREHPIEAGLDPSFEEVTEESWPAIRQDFWNRWLERRRRDVDPLLEELRAMGLDPRALYQGFEELVRYPDVTFPTVERPVPDTLECRRALRMLMQGTWAAMPDIEPPDGWDALQRTMRRLALLERTGDWSDVVSFCGAIGTLSTANCRPTQKRWPDKKGAKELGEAWEALLAGPIAAVLTAWREHRYPLVIEFLSRAAADFTRERRATGRLGFEDLLLGAAALLRGNPAARRALGLRYRHLLVDEFQDTDPIQAEVCFLLASDPSEGTSWRTVTPRPGGLFVVGDPKQSIYRFRRADIQTYELVKQRIAACGAVLSLTRNFRSVHPVSTLVNRHFRHAFPAEASDVQAAFAPLVTRDEPSGTDGIYCYRVEPTAKRKDAIVDDCATKVASWIAQRVASGERTPGDFLVLAYRKEVLEEYANALAVRNVPVSVTGAGLARELELRELIVVLRVLADPADSVLVAAALEGLFFGCSPADLYEARRSGIDLSVAHAPNENTSRVGAALDQLYQWWIVAQRAQADVLLDRILDDTGLLVYAASLPLGENRAGTLLHLLERVRTAVTAGASSLSGAIETIEQVLGESSGDAPLRPGRTDAVRVMNLHKAKGLEADVVILAAPIDHSEHTIGVHVRRDLDGSAVGGIVISRKESNRVELLAQPVGWQEMEDTERRFLDAEFSRLLYVAATRARRELVVAQLCFEQKSGMAEDKSAWARLAPTLAQCATTLELPRTNPPGRKTMPSTPGQLEAGAAVAATRRASAGEASWRSQTVTAAAREERDTERSYGRATRAGLGAAWGRAVHRIIEAMGRGRADATLDDFARAVLLDERLGDTPEEIDRRVAELHELLDELRATEAWQMLQTGGAFELPIVAVTTDPDGTRLTEGVLDAMVEGQDGIRVFDWKTDNVSDTAWAERSRTYQAQVNRYAEMLQSLTGRSAAGSLIHLPR